MTTANAIRFLHHQAALCRGRDDGEALCLLFPALLRVFNLQPMEDVEAAAFRYEFKKVIETLPKFRDATDREDESDPMLKALRPDPPAIGGQVIQATA